MGTQVPESVFDAPGEIRLDRKPNPHVAFGFGDHLYLGAAHARLVIRTLLAKPCEKVARIELPAAEEQLEREEAFTRKVGYTKLRLRFFPLNC